MEECSWVQQGGRKDSRSDLVRVCGREYDDEGHALQQEQEQGWPRHNFVVYLMDAV